MLHFFSLSANANDSCNEVLQSKLLESYVSSSDYLKKSLGLALATELSADDLGANFASEGSTLLPDGIPITGKLNGSYWRARMKQLKKFSLNQDIERKKEYIAYTSGSKYILDAWLKCKRVGQGDVTFIETSIGQDRRLRFQWHGENNITRIKILNAELSNATWRSEASKEMFINRFLEVGNGQELRATLSHTDVCFPIEVDIWFQKYYKEEPIGTIAATTAFHPAIPNCGKPLPDPPLYAVVSASSNPPYDIGPYIIYPTKSVYVVDGRNGIDRHHYFKCGIDENWMVHAEFQHHSGGKEKKGPASVSIKASDTIQPVHWGKCKIECLASKHTPGVNPCSTDAVVQNWNDLQ
jgi:hypothetical protein